MPRGSVPEISVERRGGGGAARKADSMDGAAAVPKGLPKGRILGLGVLGPGAASVVEPTSSGSAAGARWPEREAEKAGAGLWGGGLTKGRARSIPFEGIDESKVVEPTSSGSGLFMIELAWFLIVLTGGEGLDGDGGSGAVQLFGNAFEFFKESIGFSRVLMVVSPTPALARGGTCAERAGGRGTVPRSRLAAGGGVF